MQNLERQNANLENLIKLYDSQCVLGKARSQIRGKRLLPIALNSNNIAHNSKKLIFFLCQRT